MKLKRYYMQFNNETSCCIEECESPSGYWVKYHDAKDTIESQQQEIDQLKTTLADWKYNVKCDADQIAALISDKDEQAGRIMRMEGGLRRLKSSFQWLSEDMRGRGYKDWAEDKMNDIDALLGGAKDGK